MKNVSISPQHCHSGSLILVNSQYPYHGREHELPLVPVQPGSAVRLWVKAARALQSLLRHIGGEQAIAAVSGWRSLAEQQQIWDQSLVDNGPEFTRQYVALPGCSEHQTGLAIDLGDNSVPLDFIRPAFPEQGICQIFRQQAAAFGFMERYPQGKEAITGISHEPWHFRYVGEPHAAIISEHGFTLEEYINFLRQFPYGKRAYQHQQPDKCYYVSFLAVTQPCLVELPERCWISGNNVDGLIITAEGSAACG